MRQTSPHEPIAPWRRVHRRRLLWGGVLVAVAVVLLTPVHAGAGGTEDMAGLRWSASIDEREVAGSGAAERLVPAGDPVRLSPDEPVVVSVTVEGGANDPVTVERVRIEGNVLGMTFFAYTTRVDLRAEAGDEDTRRFSLDLWDLEGQATGLIPAQVVLLEGREEVASGDFPVRIEGSLDSVYGAFGLAVGALTLLVLVGALWSLAIGRLHGNRWRRGTAFAVPGLGVGLTLTFTVSALGWLLPSASTWLTLVLVCGGIGFLAGYLSPAPDDEQLETDAEDGGYVDAKDDLDAGVGREHGTASLADDVSTTAARPATGPGDEAVRWRH